MIAGSRGAQRGFTVWGWMIVIAIAGFFLLLAARLGPLYIKNFSVRETVKALRNEPELGDKAMTEVRLAVERKFDVNRIEAIQAVCRIKDRPCMKIEKTKDKMTINANYETRVHILANVDAVVKFDDNYIEIPIKGGS